MTHTLLRIALVVSFASLVAALPDSARAAEEKTEKKSWKRDRGAIEKISAQRREVTIQVKKEDKRRKISSVVSQTYKLAADCTFGTQSNKKAALSDLKVGDEVNVSYEEESGLLIAHRIAQVTKEADK
jgi:Cu/Ag efflux protein CusF